jgi:hypothetical protein
MEGQRGDVRPGKLMYQKERIGKDVRGRPADSTQITVIESEKR